MMYLWIILYMTNIQQSTSRIRHFTHHVHRKSYRPITSAVNEVNPCHNGGTYTTVGSDEKVCVCPEKFMGEKCQDVNFCYNKPCKNCGRCTVKPSYPHYTCECCKKYYGPECQYENFCEPNPCGRFGKCNMIGRNWTCTCQPGFKGVSCNVLDNCYPNPCKNDGVCVPTDAFGSIRCNCGSKWTGTLCNVPNACLSNPCQNDAQCLDKNGDFSCVCLEGYTGKTCADTVCSPNPCQNEGTCIQNQQNEVQCVCPAYAKGARCEVISPCLMNPCKNDAKCIDSHSGKVWPLTPMQYYCICKPPYVGRHCEQEPCSLCDINAYCVMGRCRCNTGYIGDGVVCKKQPDVCTPNPCYNEGTCINKLDGTYQCVCKASFHPPLCKIRDSCSPNPCNGGRCFPLPDGSYNCDCPQGFIGNKCQVKDPCAQGPCKNNGLCQRSEEEPEKYTCLCKGRWGGNLCEKCMCPKTTHVRAASLYCDAVTGACKCPGESKYSKRDKICYYSQASRKSLVSVCLPNPCKHNGVCIPVESSYDCKCPSRFTGPHCEVDKCLQCDENANCFGGECTCARGYVGNGYRCQRSCASQCLEFQFCSETGACQCIPGYYMIGVQCFQSNDYSFKEPVWNTPRPFNRDDDDDEEQIIKPGKPHRPTTRPTPISRRSRPTRHRTTHHTKTPHSTRHSTQHSTRHSTIHSTPLSTAAPTKILDGDSIKPPGLPPTNPTPSGSVGPPGIEDDSNENNIGPPGTRREIPGKFIINVESDSSEKNDIQVAIDDGNLHMPKLANDTAENSIKRENLTRIPKSENRNESYIKVTKELPDESNKSRNNLSNDKNSTINNTTGHENIDDKNIKFKSPTASGETNDTHKGSHFETLSVRIFRPTQPIMIKHQIKSKNLKFIDELTDDASKNKSYIKSQINSANETSYVTNLSGSNKSNDINNVRIMPSNKANVYTNLIENNTKNKDVNKLVRNLTHLMYNLTSHLMNSQAVSSLERTIVGLSNKSNSTNDVIASESLGNSTRSVSAPQIKFNLTRSVRVSQNATPLQNGSKTILKMEGENRAHLLTVKENPYGRNQVKNGTKNSQRNTSGTPSALSVSTKNNTKISTRVHSLSTSGEKQVEKKNSSSVHLMEISHIMSRDISKNFHKTVSSIYSTSKIVSEDDIKKSSVDNTMNPFEKTRENSVKVKNIRKSRDQTEKQASAIKSKHKTQKKEYNPDKTTTIKLHEKPFPLNKSLNNSTSWMENQPWSRDNNIYTAEWQKTFHKESFVRGSSKETSQSKHASKKSRDLSFRKTSENTSFPTLSKSKFINETDIKKSKVAHAPFTKNDKYFENKRDVHQMRRNESSLSHKNETVKTFDIRISDSRSKKQNKHGKTNQRIRKHNNNKTANNTTNKKKANSTFTNKHSKNLSHAFNASINSNVTIGNHINKSKDHLTKKNNTHDGNLHSPHSPHPGNKAVLKIASAKRRNFINDTNDLEFLEKNIDNYEAILKKLNSSKEYNRNLTISADTDAEKKNELLSNFHNVNKITPIQESTSSVFPHLLDYEDSEEALEHQGSELDFFEQHLQKAYSTKPRESSTNVIVKASTVEKNASKRLISEDDDYKRLKGYIDEEE